MSPYLVLPLLALVSLFQAAAVPHLAVWGVFPDLPLLVVVAWSVLHGARQGMLWAFGAGLFLDLLSGAPFGAATISLMAVALLAGRVRSGALQAHLVLLLPFMFAATIVYDLLYLLVLLIAGRALPFWDVFLRLVLPSALYNTLLLPPVFWLLRWLSRRFAPVEVELAA